MKYLRKFNESISKVDERFEDIEDCLLELVDIGYKIEKFESGYLDDNFNFSPDPKSGYLPGYRFDFTNSTEGGTNDMLDDPSSLDELIRYTDMTYKIGKIFISGLRRLESNIGKVEMYKSRTFKSVEIRVIDSKKEATNLTLADEAFYKFKTYVINRIRAKHGYSYDYDINIDKNTKKIELKFEDDISKYSFDGIVKRINKLSSMVSYHDRTSFVFDITPNFKKKTISLTYKHSLRYVTDTEEENEENEEDFDAGIEHEEPF